MGRPLRAARVLALVAVLTCTGCSATTAPAPPASPLAASTPAPAPVSPSPTPTARAAAPASAPSRLVIAAIGLDETLIDLGIAEDGRMEVPVDYDEVGWFTGGGRPGGIGPTVIAAHVDSPTGPAVFLDLEKLVVGDVVDVHDVEGVLHTYRVTETAAYPKTSFPTARVFGATVRDELRLITCGGIFDRDAGSYVDNRVVFAERV